MFMDYNQDKLKISKFEISDLENLEKYFYDAFLLTKTKLKKNKNKKNYR